MRREWLMDRRGIILLLLAIVFACSAECMATNIPAAQDVYISLGTGNEMVFNQTDILLCGINVTEVNKTRVSNYPGVPVIQFDISGLNITDNDVAILVLKAADMRQPDPSAMVALLTIGSDWNEESDMTTFLVNILPAWSIIKKNDLTQISSNTDGDKIFAFDVSKKLMDAKKKGNKISFLLEAISNSSSEINFLSRESGQGPYLMIMPYPTATQSAQTLQTPPASQDVQTFFLAENASETSKTNETVPATTVLKTAPKSNEKISKKLTLP
jgi:hypothetical protein